MKTILKAAGNQDRFVLAITRPSGDGAETTYLMGSIVDDDINQKLTKYPFLIRSLIESARAVTVYDIEDGTCTRRS